MKISQIALYSALLSAACTSAAQAESWLPLAGRHANSRNVAVSSRATPEGRRISISIPGIFVDELNLKAQRFTSLRVENEGFLTDLGRPRLPVVRRLIEVPRGARVSLEHVEARFSPLRTRMNLIFPVQPSVQKRPGAANQFTFDRKFYLTGTPQQFPAASLGAEEHVKGKIYRWLEVFPFRYDPRSGTLEASSTIDVHLKIEGGAKAPAAADAREGVLMLVADKFADAPSFRELVQWKRLLGFDVRVVRTSETGESPDAIRAHLIDQYARGGLDYLLIVGDVEHVRAFSGSGYESHFSDNFYAALDPVPYKDDRAAPDIAVGRLSIHTEAELDVVVGKILKYEKAEFSTNDWLRKVSFIATDDTGFNRGVENTHDYVIKTVTTSRGVTGSFPQLENPGGDQLYAIRHKAKSADLLSEFREGRSIIEYSGHGVKKNWDGPLFFGRDVHGLDHPDALPFVISHACLTGSFGGFDDAFGEEWLRAPKGAIAFLGASNYSYWDEDNAMEKQMWEVLFEHRSHRLGDLVLAGKNKVKEVYGGKGYTDYYYEVYNLLGDPTVSLYTDVPRILDLELPKVEDGQQEFVIGVQDEQGAVAGALVHVTNEDGTVSRVARSDSDGRAAFQENGDALPAGRYTVAVSAPDHVVKISSLQIGN